jgi:hypothetical protein
MLLFCSCSLAFSVLCLFAAAFVSLPPPPVYYAASSSDGKYRSSRFISYLTRCLSIRLPPYPCPPPSPRPSLPPLPLTRGRQLRIGYCLHTPCYGNTSHSLNYRHLGTILRRLPRCPSFLSRFSPPPNSALSSPFYPCPLSPLPALSTSPLRWLSPDR